MEAQKLETEFSYNWEKLTVVQKESILHVVKNFADANEGIYEEVAIPKDVMDAIKKDRKDYTNGNGKNYGWEEVKDYVLNRHGKKAS